MSETVPEALTNSPETTSEVEVLFAEARDGAYKNALTAAKHERDQLMPAFEKMRQRMRHLQSVILSLSALTSVVDDEDDDDSSLLGKNSSYSTHSTRSAPRTPFVGKKQR